MARGEISSVRESNRIVIPDAYLPEAYIIDQQNDDSQESFEVPELGLPDSYLVDKKEPAPIEKPCVIIIEL